VTLERLWAGWRSAYVSGLTDDAVPDGAEAGSTQAGDACVLCRLVAATDDEEALVLERTSLTITVMNLYPYGSGHLMVAPKRHVPSVEDLDDAETTALARAQTRAVQAIRATYAPDGINLGANLGRAAGAGIPGHLHVHVLPRWSGDTNFMTSIAEVRVLPESLDVGYQKLRAHWPHS
jgi:diadenosine tetraphosphate (Ap4A) HIT family hydrolase